VSGSRTNLHCWRWFPPDDAEWRSRDAPFPSKDFSLSQPFRVTTVVAFLAFSSFERASREIIVADEIVPRLFSRFVTFKAFIRERTLYRETPYSGAAGLSFLGFLPLQDPST